MNSVCCIQMSDDEEIFLHKQEVQIRKRSANSEMAAGIRHNLVVSQDVAEPALDVARTAISEFKSIVMEGFACYRETLSQGVMCYQESLKECVNCYKLSLFTMTACYFGLLFFLGYNHHKA